MKFFKVKNFADSYHSRNPRFRLEKIIFSHQKAPLFKTLLVPGQKKGAFSIPGIHKTIEAKGAFLGAFFRFFAKLHFFKKIKAPFL